MMMTFLFIIPFISATRLSVNYPSIAFDGGDNTIPVNVADFGYVPYGHTLKGKLIFIDDTCKELDLVKEYESSPLIVISQRGNCSFLQKALHTQKAGAIMLIVIDTKEEEINNVLMISEQTNQVFIPTIMISKSNGADILDLFNYFPKVLVSILFELNQEEIVDLQYFITSIDPHSYTFLTQFYPFAKKLSEKIKFKPFFIEYYCVECARHNFTVNNDQCISGGRYCQYDPDNKGPLLGRDIVMEDLRQICIHQQNGMNIWWQYALTYKEQCLDQIQNISNLTQCSLKSMKEIDIEAQNILKCVKDSFEGSNVLLDENTILSKQREEFQNLQFSYWPTLLINGVLYRGDLFIDNVTEGSDFNINQFAVLEAICDGFYDNVRPSICEDDSIVSINENGQIIQQNNKVYIVLTWVFLGLLVLVTLIFIFFFLRRTVKMKLKEDLEGQVGQSFSQYWKMGETKETKPNPTEKILGN